MERAAVFALPMCALLLLLSSLQLGAQGARMPSARVQGQLPPCKGVPGGIPGWDCYDPPQHPLPPCDFKHHSPGIDCWPKGTPPASDVTDLIHATSTTPAAASDAQSARVQGELPPCKDVPGGIPGWDCFDPPTHPLPPCDFRHQRAGFDCWPPSPPAPKATVVTDDSAAVGASTDAVQSTAPHDSNARSVQGMLPPCKDVPGGTPGWDCYDPPQHPLPPCDFKHHSPGIDCWPKDPPAARP